MSLDQLEGQHQGHVSLDQLEGQHQGHVSLDQLEGQHQGHVSLEPVNSCIFSRDVKTGREAECTADGSTSGSHPSFTLKMGNRTPSQRVIFGSC